MIHVDTVRFRLEQIQDGRRGDPNRRKRNLTAPPLLDANRCKTELVAVERQRSLDIGAAHNHVIEAGHSKLEGHGRRQYSVGSLHVHALSDFRQFGHSGICTLRQ